MPQTLSQESDPSQPGLDSSQLEVLEMLTSFNTDEDMTGEDSDYLTGSWDDGDFQHDGWTARTQPISRWNVESGSTSYSESEFVSPSPRVSRPSRNTETATSSSRSTPVTVFSRESSSSRSMDPQSPPPLSTIPPPPFRTPPRLQSVEQVMSNCTGTDVASLRVLTTALARDAIYGREEMVRSSLSGRRGTGVLSQEKLNYIKTLVRSRVPDKPSVEFEHIWTLCRGSLSKSCQALRTANARRRIDVNPNY